MASCWMCHLLANAKCDIISENWAQVRFPKPSSGFRTAKTHHIYILRHHAPFAGNKSQFVAELVRLVGTVHESIRPSFPEHFHVHGFGAESPPAGKYKTVMCWVCELLSQAKCEIISNNWARVKRPPTSRGFPGAKTHEMFVLRRHVPFGMDASQFLPEVVRSVGTVYEAIRPRFPAHFYVRGFGKESPPALTYKALYRS